ncbi:MAG: hypothetical protein HY425_00025 [Candidatus Levybacteria bacterium]|nr:hypothetical protein [Candidatus Levybacteria bacterium]
MYSDLIASIKTVRDADRLFSEINMLETSPFKPETISSISLTNAEKITEIISKNNFDANNQDLYRTFWENLKDEIRKLKIIKLVLAFDPTRKTIERIHSFISGNIGIGYILDIEVEKNVLAGAIVIYGGKYRDYSVKKSLEETFRLNRSVILNLFQDPNH